LEQVIGLLVLPGRRHRDGRPSRCCQHGDNTSPDPRHDQL